MILILCRKTGLLFRLGLFAVLFSVPFSVPLFAQAGARLQALLNQDAISWSDAAYFVLQSSEPDGYNSMQGASDPSAAFGFAAEQKWLPNGAAPGDTVPLNGVALLLMRSFDLKGGIFYSITKSPHHAYRELVSMEVIRGRTDPDMHVSGQQLLLLTNRLLSKREEALKAVQK